MKKKRNRIKNAAIVAGLLIAAMFVAVMPAQAYTTELRITDTNLNILQYHAVWTPYSNGDLMLWPSLLDVTNQYKLMVGNIAAVQVGDGECVSLVKALSKNPSPTGSWIRSDNVMASVFTPVQPGATIATFDSNGNYKPGHAAVFMGYYYNNIGQRIGFWVWDQNYIPDHGHVVARHVIWSKGTTYPTDPTNANNYYVIRVSG